jgi:hypothetical protein
MNTFERLESILKVKPHINILGIRYYNGIRNFSSSDGSFTSDSLEKSLDLLLEAIEAIEQPVKKSKNGIAEQVI